MKRWLLWASFVIVWTVALELPVPDTGAVPGGTFILTHRMVFAKVLHIGLYGLLAVLSGWVPLPVRYRWVMMFFLMCHAVGTELLQDALHEYCHRGGSLGDAVINQAAILAGALASWKWWMQERS